MSVSSNSRRCGLGKKLCRLVIEFAKRNKYKEIFLTTLKEMDLAMKLYKSAKWDHY